MAVVLDLPNVTVPVSLSNPTEVVMLRSIKVKVADYGERPVVGRRGNSPATVRASQGGRNR
jgi:hypothetical protein